MKVGKRFATRFLGKKQGREEGGKLFSPKQEGTLLTDMHGWRSEVIKYSTSCFDRASIEFSYSPVVRRRDRRSPSCTWTRDIPSLIPNTHTLPHERRRSSQVRGRQVVML